MRSSSKRLFLGLALLLSACADDGGPTGVSSPGSPQWSPPESVPGTPPGTPPSGPAQASLVVSVSTAGTELDVDGYTIEANGDTWWVAINDSVTIDLPAGDHQVSLGEVSGNCLTADGVDVQSIQLSGGAIASAQFYIICMSIVPSHPGAPCFQSGAGCSSSELGAWEVAEKARIAAEQTASQPVYDSLKVAWGTYLSDFPRGQSQFLMCDPLQYTGGVKIVGPEGADMSIGPHKLRIPAGALSERVVVTGVIQTSLMVSIELAPHGLQFVNGVTLEMNYGHCDTPAAFEPRVAYLDPSFNVLEWLVTVQGSSDDEIITTIDHFSKYAVAY